MTPYLIANPPKRPQHRAVRRETPSGVVILHTAEGHGAANVARFIRNRDTPGSYHDLVDNREQINLLPYSAESFHDGTGSNPHSCGLSFATMASAWPRMPAAVREAHLSNGAACAARYAAWVHTEHGVTIPVRRITRAESERRLPGFLGHGERDPGRRSDPGALFPWDRFLDLYAAHLQPPPAPASEEDDDMARYTVIRKEGGAIALVAPGYFRHVSSEELAVTITLGQAAGPPRQVNDREWDVARAVALGGVL